MFQGSLLKRTMTLVLGALISSAILATVAFVFAGRNATINLEVSNAISQDQVYNELILENPDFFNNE